MRRSFVQAMVEVLESRRLLSSGPLDTTFDADGKVLHNAGLGGGFTDVLVQNDGKVVAVGQVANTGGTRTYGVFRYNENGTPDTTFGGGDGIASLPWSVTQYDFFEIALTSGGAIVVAGALDGGSFGVGRFAPTGVPDTSFNATGFRTDRFTASSIGIDAAQLAVQPDGRILVAGGTGMESFSRGTYVKRYNANGALDTTFGPQGVQFINVVDALSTRDLVVRNGKIVIAGLDDGNNTYLARLLVTNGALDSTFGGGDGIATDVIISGTAVSIAIQHDDSIYSVGSTYPVGSTSNPRPLLARFTPAGALDTTYGGGDGLVTDGSFNGSYADLVVQSDGRVITVGGQGAFFIQRYLHTGAPDTTFGTNGRQTTQVSQWDAASEVALAPYGKIVAAGFINDMLGSGITRHLNDIAAIAGSAYNDQDGDGQKDLTEPVIFGRTVYLDLDNNAARDAGEPLTEANHNGAFTFNWVHPGTYSVRQLLPDNWVQTEPTAGAAHVVSPGVGTVARVDFGSRFTLSQLYGAVFNDIDGDGAKDATDTGKSNVRVYIDGNGNGLFDAGETSVMTGQHATHSTANYQFNLPAGTYTVRVEVPPGFTQTLPAGGAARTVTLASNSSSRLNDFGLSYPFASVEGFAFNDVDGDGIQESGDNGVPSRIIYDDVNNDGVRNLGPGRHGLEPYTFTSSSGYYVLRGLTAGQHRIRQVLPAGVTNTKPTANGGAYLVMLAENQAVAGSDFGSAVVGTAGGFLYHDDNGNGIRDSGEGAFTGYGVSVYLDLDVDGAWDTNEPTSYTGGTGKFEFNNLVAGNYTARIMNTSIVRQTYPADGAGIAFSVTGGQHTSVGPFGVQALRSVTGYAFNDANGNGTFDSGESGLFNRTIYADANDDGDRDAGEMSYVTNSSGFYALNLPFGSHRIRQVVPTGYEQTGRNVVNAPSSEFAATGIVELPEDVNVQGARFNFGSRAVAVTRVYGFVIRDYNGNGVTDSGEPGNTPGDTVYVDANNNGSLDSGERSMTTGTNGWFFDLPAGSHVFRQQLPVGWMQTMPGGNAPLTATVPSTPPPNPIHAGFFGRYQPPQALDGNFAVNGRYVVDLGDDYDTGAAMAVQADGKVIVAGNGASADIVRLTPGGQRDNTFVYPAALAASDVDFFNVAIQPDGKIVAGGWQRSTTQQFFSYRPMIARFNADGSLDSSFGTGGVALPIGDVYGKVGRIELVAGGKIVFGGDYSTSPEEFEYVGRVNADGTADTSFGTGGHTIVDFNGVGFDSMSDMVLLPDGKILLGGSGFTGEGERISLARFTASGQRDTTFDGDGIRHLNAPTGYYGQNLGAMALRSDGKVLLTGAIDSAWDDSDLLVMLVDANGAVQSGFGVAGRVVIEAGADIAGLGAVAIEPSTGRIFAAGGVRVPVGVTGSDWNYAVVALRADGSPDPTFNDGRPVYQDFGGNYEAYAGLLLVTPTRLLASGRANDNFAADLTVAAYEVTAPAGSQQMPYHGSPFAVGATPITIQAEDFDLGGQGVAYHDIDSKNDGGQYRPADGVDIMSHGSGLYRVGGPKAGEWMEYTVDVATAGEYELEFRVSQSASGAQFHAEIDGVNVTGQLSTPDTGSFNTFTSVKKTVSLSAGQHVLRLAQDANASNGYAAGVDWIKVSRIPNEPGQQPFHGAAFAVGTAPITIEAEDYDLGGEGVAYHDTDSKNDGGRYRPADGVDIMSHGSGLYRVGGPKAGEWLEYTIDVQQAGDYALEFRVSQSASGAQFHAEIDGVNVTGSITAPNTGSFNSFISVKKTVTLSAGQHVLRLAQDNDATNGYAAGLDWIKVTAVSPPPSGQMPYHGSAFAVGASPVTIQAEDYDLGGDGVAYHDTDARNDGGHYRPGDGVDIMSHGTGSYRVGGPKAGEWLEYTIDVQQAGDYELEFRVSQSASGALFHAEIGRVNVTGSLTVPSTGSFNTFTSVKKMVTLGAGQHVLRLAQDANGSNGYAAGFDWVKLSPVTATREL